MINPLTPIVHMAIQL